MRTDVVLTAFGLGAVTGMRSLGALALLSTEQKDDTRGWLRAHPLWSREPQRPIANALRMPMVSNALRGGALAEAIADKMPDMPDRIDPVPLLGRAVLGALAGAAAAEIADDDRLAPCIAGALGAIVGTYGAYYARRWVTRNTEIPDKAVALMEDALVLGAGKLLAHSIAGQDAVGRAGRGVRRRRR